MLTEYDTEQALATFRCGGIDPHLFLVSRWQGSEGVSQLYRFEVSLASADPDVDLEKILGSRATLTLRTDAGDILPWHGIVTELRQTRRDETYAYYRAVLEPQLALLRLFRQSRVYVHADAQAGGKPDLATVIRSVLEQAGLTQEGDPDAPQAPHYAIRVPDSDLAATQSRFICQFEETSLDFLMRRLEHAGVYFWFEQAENREVVVFGNNNDQHPDQTIPMLWRPEGDLNPEAGAVAITRFDHTVSVQPKGVVLRDFSVSQPSLDLTVKADVNPDAPGASDRFDALGSVEVYGSHYTKQEGGERIAAIRAEEIASQRNRYFGESRAAGLRAGRVAVLDDHFRDSLNTRYYVIDIQHEGQQSLPRQTPEQDEQARFYHAQFTVVPASRQYRPARTIRTPRVAGFLSAIVMAEGEGQYAQMNEYGCYRIRFLFAPPGSGGQDDANSAWVRMATPYAGSQHGMNLPLLKGTEVLVSFLGGDPDRPVIVAAIPNEENPSIRNQDNATRPALRTAGQNALEFEDKQGQEHARLSSPAGNTTIHLGADPKNADQSGIRLATTAHMGTTSSSYIQQVPGAYHQEISCEGKVDVDPEPQMAFQAAWDMQRARQLEEQALLPDAPAPLQLKALTAKRSAGKAALGLLAHQLMAAQNADPVDQDRVAALQRQFDAASRSDDTIETALSTGQKNGQSPQEILQQMLAAESQESGDEQESAGSEGGSDCEEPGSGNVKTTFAGANTTFTAGVVSEFTAGAYNTLTGGLQTSLLIGGDVDIKAAGALEIDASPTLTFDLKGKDWTTTKYRSAAVREEARALERDVQIVADNRMAGTVEDHVRMSYTMNVDGPYTVAGGVTAPAITFTTGSSKVEIKGNTQRYESHHIRLSNPGKTAKIEVATAGNTVSIKASGLVTIEGTAGVRLQAQSRAEIRGNMVTLG